MKFLTLETKVELRPFPVRECDRQGFDVYQHHRDESARIGVILKRRGSGQMMTEWYADFMPGQTWWDFTMMQKAVEVQGPEWFQKTAHDQRVATLSGWPTWSGAPTALPYAAGENTCSAFKGETATHKATLQLGWHHEADFFLSDKAVKEITKKGLAGLLKLLRAAGHAIPE